MKVVLDLLCFRFSGIPGSESQSESSPRPGGQDGDELDGLDILVRSS